MVTNAKEHTADTAIFCELRILNVQIIGSGRMITEHTISTFPNHESWSNTSPTNQIRCDVEEVIGP